MRFLLSSHIIVLVKVCIHMLCLGWLVHQYWLAIGDQLGADPVEALLRFTGIGALNLLLLSLMISPAIRLLKLPKLIEFRRLIGLYAFAYACAHLFNFIAFELQFDWQLIGSEIIERPYIAFGMGCLTILVLLALTSFNKVKRQMGTRWQRLHNWVYLALVLAVFHFGMSVKLDLTEPIIYSSICVSVAFGSQNASCYDL